MSEIIPLAERRIPDKDELEKIRRQVADRVKEEQSSLPDEKKSGDGGDEISSRLIRDCLRMNELGDGILFRELHRDMFAFNKAMDSWMYFNGQHWEIDQMSRASAAVENVVTKYIEESLRVAAEMKEVEDGSTAYNNLKDLRSTLNKRVWALRSTRRRAACLTMAHTCDDGLAIRGDEIDQNPWLLACNNGVVDLRTGKSRDGRTDDFLLKASGVAWKGFEAPCERWLKFIYEIFEEDHLDPEEEHPVSDFLQRLLGYSILGSDQLHIFPVWTGIGRNGKGTIVKVMSHILGKLAGPVRPEMLLDQGRNANASGPTPEIIALRGLRMAFASETNEGCRISSAQVKRLTGGDELSGRSPHDKYEVSFNPTHTIFLLTNSLPSAPAEDFAFWERVLVVHFPLSYVNREPKKENERRADGRLFDMLVEEDSGILGWLVRGCLLWQQAGLNPPPKVMVEVEEYQREEDNVGAFVDYCCFIDEKAWVGASQLYDAFVEWWKKFVSRYEMKQKKFGMIMRKRFKAEKVGGVYRYYGIGLLDTDHIRTDE